MEISLPVVLHLFHQVYSVGTVVGIVYSANVSGAATGALVTGSILMGTLGGTGSRWLLAVASIPTQPFATLPCFAIDWIASARNFHPQRALYIGLGSSVGVLCLQHLFPGIRIDMVEINEQLLNLVDESSPAVVKDSLSRSDVYVTDGRRFLLRHEGVKYDFIQVVVNAATASVV
jgi:hypothetical protein